MPTKSEPLESTYASDTLIGLIRSGLSLLIARRIRPRSRSLLKRLHPRSVPEYILYFILIIIPATVLETFQRLRTLATGKPRQHPGGSWQFYLQTGLREDTAHHTNETTGYHVERPTTATDLDDMTAWVMAVIQLLWNYDELMGVIWDEWTVLRLTEQATQRARMTDRELFRRLQRQWELTRPYTAPLNGTYADARRAAFERFIQPRLDALPTGLQEEIAAQHAELARLERQQYRQQMSLLATLDPKRLIDIRRQVPLWQASVGLVLNGQYYLVRVVDHDESGGLLVYGLNGEQERLDVHQAEPMLADGTPAHIQGDAVYHAADDSLIGYLDMTPAAQVKWQLRQILIEAAQQSRGAEQESPDILLVETPRGKQMQLRRLLPRATQESLDKLSSAPVIINWDELHSNASLAELRRTRRGVGDHALTIMRTESSFIFDQSHIFFDGTWSLATAEVLTNAAVRWCERCITLTPSETTPAQRLLLEPSEAFLTQAKGLQDLPEISAETTIWDISSLLALRKLLAETGTRLTVNDLLVITRIFHASHYRPSPSIQEEVDRLGSGPGAAEREAARAINRSLQRGRVTNPALLIPVDASPTDPRERIFPITFRNLMDDLVRVWDDTWDSYQAYRRIEPPDTPEGIAAFQQFSANRSALINNLRGFSHILAANKAVAIRGDSLNIAILKLLVGLPLWLQILLKQIPEHFLPLNEIIRGDEVYSNVGQVAQSSSLSRFMTAKDDGNTKALAWGVMSDATGRLVVTMRDFRPHVKPLQRIEREDLARALAQDYVSTYTADLIGLVARLSAMLQAEEPRAYPTRARIRRDRRRR